LGGALLFAYLFNFLYNYKYKRLGYKKTVQNTLIVLLIFIVAAFSVLTIRRNADWKDDISVWTALANQPVSNSIKNAYLGMVYFQTGDYDKAALSFKKVVAEKGDVKFANYFLTFISVIKSINQGDKKSAEKSYNKLIKLSLPSERGGLYGLKGNIDNIPALSTTNAPANNRSLKEFQSKISPSITPKIGR
jgi:tetratricopeptide (TPR) repeat protein